MNNISASEFRGYKSKSPRQFIKPVEDFLNEADEILQKGIHLTGDKTPWDGLHNKFRFREGEVTIWSGYNGSGKSMVMGQCALWLTELSSVLIASMEMKGAVTVARMLRQGFGERHPSREFIDEFKERTENKLWIYDQTDNVSIEDVMSMIDWAAEQKNVKHIMIDSLMMCGVNQEIGDNQKNFMAQLCTKAKEFNIHIHLVAHSKKPPQGLKNYIPNRYDISGSAKIADLAFNVIIINPNEQKKRDREENKTTAYDDPDGWFIVDKQRNGEWTGNFGFLFHTESLRCTEKYCDKVDQW
jgi:twinkle protein